MRSLLNFIYYSSWFVLPLLLFSILNFGNYTFLSYNVNGYNTSPIINNLKYLRIVLPAIPLLILFGNLTILRLFIFYLIKNFDIVIFLMILIIRAFIDDDFIYPMWFVFSILAFFIMFLIFRVLSKNVIVYMQKVTIFILLSVVIVIPFTFLSIPKLFSSHDIYFSSKSAFTYYNLIIIVSTISYLIISKTKLRLGHVIFIILNILVILLSGRRTPFITALIVIGIYLLFYSINFKSVVITASIVALSLANIEYLSDHFLSVERLEKIDFDDEGYDSSYRARLELRTFYMDLIKKSNLLGVGFGDISISDKKTLSTHNTYLTAYVIMGFFGVLFYIVLIFRSIMAVIFFANKDIFITYLILFIPLFTINWVETNFLPGQIFFIYTISVIITPRFLK